MFNGDQKPSPQHLMELQSAVQVAPVGFFIMDRELQFLYLNECMAEINGNLLQVQLGDSLEVCHLQCGEYLIGVCQAVFENGRPVLNLEVQSVALPESTGSRHWLLNFVPVTDERGQVTRVTGAATEFTEKKKVETELNAKLARREEFFSILSHELRTPLTSLYARIQLLHRSVIDQPLPPQALLIDKVKKVLMSSQMLNHWVDVLLDVARIQSGNFSIEKEEGVNLTKKISDVVCLLSEEIERTGSTVTFIDTEHEPILGFWDSFRVGQVVSNLLCNALKYGQGKPIEITVSLLDKKDGVRISVRDHGVGISPEHLFEVFKRYKRVRPDRNIGGCGLGLYIVKEVVKAHGGTIQVLSEPNEGALFICDLPLRS